MRTWGRRELGILTAAAALALLAFSPGARPPANGCAVSLAGAERDHLARCDHGATVRASSVMRTRGHALFLIDGDTRDGRRRWSSLAADERPRIEIVLPEARLIGQVVLYRPKHGAGAAKLDAVLRILEGDDEGWQDVVVRAKRVGAELHLELDPVETRALEITLSSQDGARVELVEVEVLPGVPAR